jgi:hypothetical protein
LIFKILKNNLVTVLHRSVVRSAADASHRNERVSLMSDIKESLKLLDTKLSFVWKDSHHKHKSRKIHNDLSNRTRSKVDYTDQHIDSRTWSKINSVNNSSNQNLFFPLHDTVLFQGHGKIQAYYLQSRVLECKVYDNVLLNFKSQVDFKQLTRYQTFIVLDSWGHIPIDNQKIPYQMVFDVEYNLIHKKRLVAGGNRTVNDKEDIYSGVSRTIL